MRFWSRSQGSHMRYAIRKLSIKLAMGHARRMRNNSSFLVFALLYTPYTRSSASRRHVDGAHPCRCFSSLNYDRAWVLHGSDPDWSVLSTLHRTRVNIVLCTTANILWIALCTSADISWIHQSGFVLLRVSSVWFYTNGDAAGALGVAWTVPRPARCKW